MIFKSNLPPFGEVFLLLNSLINWYSLYTDGLINVVLWELSKYLLSSNENMKETLPHTIDKLFWNIAVNDDENAFKTLFFQFFSPLCIFAHRYIERWETCEDVVQESFLKIWENRKVSESKHLPAIFWSQAYAIIVSTISENRNSSWPGNNGR